MVVGEVVFHEVEEKFDEIGNVYDDDPFDDSMSNDKYLERNYRPWFTLVVSKNYLCWRETPFRRGRRRFRVGLRWRIVACSVHI